MSENTTLSFAGAVSIDEVSIITSKGFLVTITPQVAGLELYEDVFSSFITGKIYLIDAQSLTTLLPLVGEEVVRLSFRTPTIDDQFKYSGEYYIYKMDDREKISEREIAFVLHFISKEAIVDLNKKTSRTYQGNVSDIAKKLITENDGLETQKPVNIEKTTSTTKFISNFWSPLRSLNYLTENAVNVNGSPSYVFFENKFGLNFISLDSLYQLPTYQTITWDGYTREISSTGISSRDFEEDYKRILEINTPETFNYMARLSSGMYGSQMIHYDLTTKKYTHVGYTPKFSEDHHLNEYPLWTSSLLARSRSNLVIENKYLNNFSQYGDVTNTKTIQRRMSLLAQASAYKLEVTIPGRTDYSAGQIFYLDVTEPNQITSEQTPDQFKDKINSGRYLVSAICHVVMRTGHECVLELVKDSFIVDLNNAK